MCTSNQPALMSYAVTSIRGRGIRCPSSPQNARTTQRPWAVYELFSSLRNGYKGCSIALDHSVPLFLIIQTSATLPPFHITIIFVADIMKFVYFTALIFSGLALAAPNAEMEKRQGLVTRPLKVKSKPFVLSWLTSLV